MKTQWPQVTLGHVWGLAVPLLVLMAVLRIEIAPNDFWWHLRVGEYIWTYRTIPTTDLFSFTRAGAQWTYQAWLAEVGWFLIYQRVGEAGVLLVHAFTIALAYSLLDYTQSRWSGRRAATVATLAGASVGMANWAVRPQTFSFPLFALVLILLEAHRRGARRHVWLLVPLFVFWANLHGAVLFGLGLVGAYFVAAVIDTIRYGKSMADARRLGIILLGCILALAVTPAGLQGMIRYFAGFLRNPVTLQANMEFMPLTLRDADGQLMIGLSLALVYLLIRYQHMPPTAHVLMILAFGLGTLWSRRVISWYGMALIPVLAETIAPHAYWQRPLPKGKSWVNLLLIAIMGVMVGLGLPWWRGTLPPWTPERVLSRSTPVAATAFLCKQAPPEARVYQEQGFGSYQIWACPRLPVFIDTRVELYPASQWEDYFAIGMGRFDWENIAAQYRLTHLMFSVADHKNGIRAAMASPCWEKLYEDDIAVIFVRRCPLSGISDDSATRAST